MRKFSAVAFVAALFAFALTGPLAAEPGYGWGDCDNQKTLSVENDQDTDQSVAENAAPEAPKADDEN
ncbi:MAG: hypothetical protein HN719_05945 [Alphaproteobacteria bacterium]|nr:hypothetical protein [Alphaproteobacteria bacterium]